MSPRICSSHAPSVRHTLTPHHPADVRGECIRGMWSYPTTSRSGGGGGGGGQFVIIRTGAAFTRRSRRNNKSAPGRRQPGGGQGSIAGRLPELTDHRERAERKTGAARADDPSTDPLTERPSERPAAGWTDGWTDGRTDRQIDRRTGGRTDGRRRLTMTSDSQKDDWRLTDDY